MWMVFMRLCKWVVPSLWLAKCSSVWADDPCPSEPFETDLQVVEQRIAVEPLRPVDWYADRILSPTFFPDERLTEGFVSGGSGGLGNHSAVSLKYDAKRYVLVYVIREWPMPANAPYAGLASSTIPAKPAAQQAVRKRGNDTYVITVARLTPKEAVEFACLANQLLAPTPAPPPPPPPYEPPSDPNAPVEITVASTVRRSNCEDTFTDGHMESAELFSSRHDFSIDLNLSCNTRQDLISRINNLLYAPIKVIFAQANSR
jgi:hypothetical protein